MLVALIRSGQLLIKAPIMIRLALAAPFLIFIWAATTGAQSVVRLNPSAVDQLTTNDNRRAVEQLRRLEQKVIVYRSLGDFADSGRLARVPLKQFEHEFQIVTGEIEVLIARMPAGQLRTQIVNALASYRDGLFWWRQIDEPRVVTVSALNYEPNATPASVAFNSSVPYTVAIHWRQAARYLARAETLLDRQ